MNNEADAACGTVREMRMLTGLAVSRGFVAGPAFLYRAGTSEQVPEYRVEPAQIDQEVSRLADAFALTRTQIRSLAQELKKRISGDKPPSSTGI
jgi:phosphoenolpyruvate-protein kinase (PTS system EI component)